MVNISPIANGRFERTDRTFLGTLLNRPLKGVGGEGGGGLSFVSSERDGAAVPKSTTFFSVWLFGIDRRVPSWPVRILQFNLRQTMRFVEYAGSELGFLLRLRKGDTTRHWRRGDRHVMADLRLGSNKRWVINQ